ncbi:MAG: hypothetical protein BAJATHORv1_20493 [Candidatus Thorarchaeota archaeon]|nr:MAG: hypothetical protein BAJATHORv1_20493 [Candidatus Thorarchaeota archaeon]
MTDKDDVPIKKMAELLRRGATMLAQSCPQCGSPILKIQDDLYCASCDRRIVVVSSDQDAESTAVKTMLPKLRETLVRKLQSLNAIIESENDPDELTKLANLMVLLLQALHRLENINGD